MEEIQNSHSLTQLPQLHGRWGKCNLKGPPNNEGLQETPFAPFERHFLKNFTQVQRCLAHLRNLIHTHELEYIVFAEIIIIKLAAMCVENPNHADNYTVQALLTRQKREYLVKPIQELLGRNICRDCDGKVLTFGMCLKVLRDKFLCHFDNFEDYDIFGNEGIGDGKWTLTDRDALLRLLFVDGKHIDDLVTTISGVLNDIVQEGSREIIEGALRMAEGHFT